MRGLIQSLVNAWADTVLSKCWADTALVNHSAKLYLSHPHPQFAKGLVPLHVKDIMQFLQDIMAEI